MTEKERLTKIANQLHDVYVMDMTKAEKNIMKILIDGGFLETVQDEDGCLFAVSKAMKK